MHRNDRDVIQPNFRAFIVARKESYLLVLDSLKNSEYYTVEFLDWSDVPVYVITFYDEDGNKLDEETLSSAQYKFIMSVSEEYNGEEDNAD